MSSNRQLLASYIQGINSPRNFILNPKASKNIANVTDSDSIVTRDTTNTLDGVSSFAINADASGEKALFLASAFTKEVQGKNCEAKFDYFGDASLYKAYVQTDSTVVSQEQQLTNVSSGTQAISFNFPCYSSGTAVPAVVIEATDNAAAAFNAGNFYIGEATNLGTVAQAESIIRAYASTPQTGINTNASYVALELNAENWDNYGEWNTSTYRFEPKRPGKYNVYAIASISPSNVLNSTYYVSFFDYNSSTDLCRGQRDTPQAGENLTRSVECEFEVKQSDIDAGFSAGFRFFGSGNNSSSTLTMEGQASGNTSYLQIKRFPSASSQVQKIGQTADVMGTVFYSAKSTCPANSLKADGSAVSRSTYATLFNVIGTTFGVGDGSTTFNLPNLEGVFVRGTGSQTINGRSKGGSALGDVTEDRLQGHYHNKSETPHSHTWQQGGASYFAGASNLGIRTDAYVANATTGGATSNVAITSPSSDGSNGTPRTAAETYPSNIAMTGCIWNAHTPAPLLKQAVTTSSEGVEKTDRIKLNCSSSSAIQETSIDGVTVGNISGNRCAITFPVGTYSGNPTCVPSVNTTETTTIRSAHINITSPTAASIGCVSQTGSSTNACTDNEFYILCQGPN